jgi:hypothetical protein
MRDRVHPPRCLTLQSISQLQPASLPASPTLFSTYSASRPYFANDPVMAPELLDAQIVTLTLRVNDV